MLAIQRKEGNVTGVKVHLLPCKINYSGPTEVERRYWEPKQTENGGYKAYFRGRELSGNSLKVPQHYQGSVLRITNDLMPRSKSSPVEGDVEDEDADEETEETKIAEELGVFDEVMVWNHDMPWSAAEDPYAKGIEEWISFASAMHTQADDDGRSKTTS
ncbi:uncharacterized protein PV09_09087 [Verruconis gallopava]|uniref:Uncharacterized protein n=1 Tax=Verruconis gallopava TaxID=253628 RepID=A0A0D2AJV0_9PEZI|nr:uncharacterized protein PV09_09087 [Verruconis gallopava]KIV99223.1 hypothetical protein PV09_09087 [Verruconis gallopava]